MGKVGMTPNRICIAVTGGIGSGKSTVMKILSDMGYPIFSADKIARNIYSDPDVLLKMKENFPDCMLTDSEVDRNKLAEIVFGDSNKVLALNAVTHPAIMRILFKQMDSIDSGLIFAEVPLLFEGGFENDFDKVIVVMRNDALRIKDAAKRDHVSEEKIQQRINNQFNYAKNSISGHTVLYNDGSIELLKQRVREIVNEIIENN